MKNKMIVCLVGWIIALPMIAKAQCPSFSVPAYPSLSYNLDATPWTFELAVSGDTTGAEVRWYRYLRNTQTKADAVLFSGTGSNTVSSCRPQTDITVRNTHYNYYCVLTTKACPGGIISAEFDVQVAIGSDCMTMDGMSFTIQSAPSAYNEGDKVQLTAYYSGYGGFHYYTWFFNGDTLKEDANHTVFSDPDNFNYSVLTIPACEVGDAGSYSVSVRDGSKCVMKTASAKTITVKPHEYMAFDDKNGTHVWSDPKNWWPAYNRLPSKADSAVVRKRCEVDVAHAVARDLRIDMTGDTAVVIRPTGALTITGRLLNCKAGDLLVRADASGNGALVLGPQNSDVPATVQFYALSEDLSSMTPSWQYIGYPMQDNQLLSKVWPGAAMCAWTNIPNKTLGGNWQSLDGSVEKAQAFTGYCMTEPAKRLYTFSGIIQNPATRTLTVPYNDQGDYPGFAFLANSWTAPIDISQMDAADFGAADATVYIMNTGTYAEARDMQPSMSDKGTGTARGQYNTIPVHAASYMAGALTVIPPMQGFFVHTKTATTLTLDYAKAVYAPAMTKVSTTPTRAPQNHKSEIINHKSIETVLRLNVSGFGAEDEVYLLTDPSFTEAFDNGWDGIKRHSSSPLSFSVLSPAGPLAVAAVPDADGLELQLDGGSDKYYTIKISNPQASASDNLYLFDKNQGVYTPFIDGAEYIYTCTGSSDRLSIVRKPQRGEGCPDAAKFVRNGSLYIRVEDCCFDACGRRVK